MCPPILTLLSTKWGGLGPLGPWFSRFLPSSVTTPYSDLCPVLTSRYVSSLLGKRRWKDCVTYHRQSLGEEKEFRTTRTSPQNPKMRIYTHPLILESVYSSRTFYSFFICYFLYLELFLPLLGLVFFVFRKFLISNLSTYTLIYLYIFNVVH